MHRRGTRQQRVADNERTTKIITKEIVAPPPEACAPPVDAAEGAGRGSVAERGRAAHRARVVRDGRHPPAGARLLRVARAVPDCGPDPRSRSAGWLTAIGAATFVCVLGLGLLANGMPDTAPIPDTTDVLWVRPGESLWDVAARVAPDADRDDVITRIRELNGMAGAELTPGSPLTVPVGR